MARYINADKWIEKLRNEKEEATNQKRKVYLQIMINSISCQPTIEIEEEGGIE